jgi:hypothetical protein
VRGWVICLLPPAVETRPAVAGLPLAAAGRWLGGARYCHPMGVYVVGRQTRHDSVSTVTGRMVTSAP